MEHERINGIQSRPIAGSASNRSSGSKLIIIAVLAIVLGAGSFVAGVQYQKGKSTSSVASAQGQTSSQNGFGGRPGGQAMSGSFGTVTAVSGTNISVQDQRANTTKTYTINASTTVTDNGTASTASAIAVGDSVMVRTNSSTSTTATAITLNPTMGGPGGAQQSSSSAGTSTSSSSI